MPLYHVSYMAPLPLGGYIQGDTSVECTRELETCVDYDEFKKMVVAGLKEGVRQDAGDIVISSMSRIG